MERPVICSCILCSSRLHRLCGSQNFNEFGIPLPALAVCNLHEMYDIIQRMLAPAVLFSWAVIFATYLRFYHSIRLQHHLAAIPTKARSPLQPYLAIYGFGMSVLLSTPPITDHCLLLMLVIFYGYEVFIRDSNNENWGESIASWVVLASIALGTLGWYVYERVFGGKWDWRVPRGAKIDLVSGRAPILEVREQVKGGLLKRAGKRILEPI
jgi:amino acid permease